jgi:hypothetical protein
MNRPFRERLYGSLRSGGIQMAGILNTKYWESASLVGLIAGLCLSFLIMATPPNIFAGLLSLEPVSPRTVGPQDTSVPCIIAGTNCQNPDGFDWTDFEQKGDISEYDVSSPEYDFEDLPPQFNIAIDVNTAKNGEILDFFKVIPIDGSTTTELYSYDDDSNIGNLASNGNGFADWILGTFDLGSVDVSSYQDPRIQFQAKWSGNSGGAESFFLVGTEVSDPNLVTGSVQSTAVPEPSTIWLLGTAMAGLCLVILKKKKR